jgi:hypothetical protein
MLLKRTARALVLLALSGPAASAATNLSGNYLVTVFGHPGYVNGATLCATLVEDGSTLGFVNSGTITLVNTINGSSESGHWFTRNFAATFEVTSGSDTIVFSGVLGHAKIQGTSFIEIYKGTPVVGGTFTATKGCPTAE